MLKHERLTRIQQMVNEQGIVNTGEIMQALDVSDMTVRRDLDELDKSGKLVRVRGGAQSLNYNIDFELSHLQKSTVKIEEKTAIARAAAALIQDHETIFLGPGTTIELLAAMLPDRDIRIVTPSLPAFEKLKERAEGKVLLIGGSYRAHTGAFCGPLANEILKRLTFTKAFISCNGLAEDKITASSLEEGEMQSIACANAKETIVLADSHKFNREDFYVFARLYNTDQLITDDEVTPDVVEHYSRFTHIIQAQTKGNEED